VTGWDLPLTYFGPRATARVPTLHPRHPRPYYDYERKRGAFIVGAGVGLGREGTLAVALAPICVYDTYVM